MTEFIITLPLFVTAFIAIAAISTVLRDGTESVRFISEDLWKETLSVQKDSDLGRFIKPIEGNASIGSTKFFASAGIAWGQDLLKSSKLNSGKVTTPLNETRTALNLEKSADLGEFYGRLLVVNGSMAKMKITWDKAPKVKISASGKELFDYRGGKSEHAEAILGLKGRVLADLFTGNNRYGLLVGGTKIDGSNFYSNYSASWYATSLVAPTGKGYTGPKWVGLAITGYLIAHKEYRSLLGLESSSEAEDYDNEAPNPW